MSKRKQTISKPSQRFGASQNQKFAGLSALLAHHPPRNSRFPNGPSVGPQVEGTEWLEGACRDLRHIKLADYDVTVDSFSAHVRDEAMNVSYVQSRTEIYRNRTGGGFPNSVVHRENESRKIYVEDPGDRLLVGQFDVFDREESNRKNAGYTGIVHQAHPPRDIYSEQVPAPTVSPPDHRYQKAVLEPPIRRPLEGQHSDRQRVEKQHTNRQKPNKQPSNGRRFMRQHTQRTQPENSRSSRQQPASVQGSRQPKLQPSLTKREDPELDSWKNVLLALEALNIKMTVEENEHVGQAHEIGGLHRQPTSLHLPVFRSRSRQHSRQGRRSGGARDGRSKTPSRSIRCTVAGPYWEWDSVSNICLQ